LDWFRSYLTDRQHYVSYNGCDSIKQTITFGVPQGSILGPILFLLYINDLPNAVDRSNLIMFADDTNMHISSSNLNDLFETSNTQLRYIYDWFNTNKLSLNLSKTVFIVFSKKECREIENYSLNINGLTLKRGTSTKFLGIHIDN